MKNNNKCRTKRGKSAGQMKVDEIIDRKKAIKYRPPAILSQWETDSTESNKETIRAKNQET